MTTTYHEKINALKELLKSDRIDYFILPNSDEFFSEYLPENEKRIEYLTGFTGSNALIIFGQQQSYFFTDGRYILQAANEIDLEEFEIINIAEQSVISWIDTHITKEDTLALNPQLNSLNFVKRCQTCDVNLMLLEDDVIDKIRDYALDEPESDIFLNPETLSGESSVSKREKITRNANWDFLVITDPQSLCWLLNIRASDVAYTPLLLAYGILFKNGDIDLFVDDERLSDDINFEKTTLFQRDSFALRIHDLRKTNETAQIDPSTTNYWVYQMMTEQDFDIMLEKDPCLLPKACKNNAEVSGMITAHEVDGLAVTKFLFWLENTTEIDELKAEEKLSEFRAENTAFLYPSFRSISSFGSNGAIIHYHSEAETNKNFEGHSLYLIDSGGQYFGQQNGAEFVGTTDVTRVIAVGEPSAEMIEDYTLVLKGHIALASAKFPRGTTGAQLDALARSPLWDAGKDYDHGTGHGVGSFLSVHEGPCGISKRNHQELVEGMVLSNEPGFYKAGEYGIRIENLMLVEEFEETGILHFKTLTLAPLDPRLINFDILTDAERGWLKRYHEKVAKVLREDLNDEEKVWLSSILVQFDC